MWTTTPLTPTFNNNIHLLQTPDYVVLYHEMIHHARIILLDGRPHASARIPQWRGDGGTVTPSWSRPSTFTNR